MSIELMQFLTCLYLAFSAILPATLSIYFFSWGRGIGFALCFMLIAEAISNSAALFFAVNSYLNLYNSLSPYLAMSIRILIATATAFSTIHLARYLITKTRRAE